MWRVVLSVVAAVFDGLMLIFMGLALIGLARGPAVRPVRHLGVPSGTVMASVHTGVLVLIAFLFVGVCLNLMAIGSARGFPSASEPPSRRSLPSLPDAGCGMARLAPPPLRA